MSHALTQPKAPGVRVATASAARASVSTEDEPPLGPGQNAAQRRARRTNSGEITRTRVCLAVVYLPLSRHHTGELQSGWLATAPWGTILETHAAGALRYACAAL
jgi:hypothetical protein